MKLQNEGRKILHLPDMNVSCTCVRVPVVRSHSISAAVHFVHHISVDEARAAIAAAPGCRVRLGSLEPRTVTEDFCRRAAALPRCATRFTPQCLSEAAKATPNTSDMSRQVPGTWIYRTEATLP